MEGMENIKYEKIYYSNICGDLSPYCSNLKCYYLTNFLRIISQSLILISSCDHLTLHPLIENSRKPRAVSLNLPRYAFG
jgi:hypothetical protein